MSAHGAHRLRSLRASGSGCRGKAAFPKVSIGNGTRPLFGRFEAFKKMVDFHDRCG
jgi:hypothetical protein